VWAAVVAQELGLWLLLLEAVGVATKAAAGLALRLREEP
jgi:hypothetical protein